MTGLGAKHHERTAFYGRIMLFALRMSAGTRDTTGTRLRGVRRSLRHRNLCARLAWGVSAAFLFSPAAAQPTEVATPRPVTADWPAVVRDVVALSPKLAQRREEMPRRRSRIAKRLGSAVYKEGMAPLARLNALVADRFPGLAGVPVPVLVPFETWSFLNSASHGHGRQRKGRGEAEFLFGAGGTVDIVRGKTGYDALVTFTPSALEKLGLTSKQNRLLHIGGSALTYGGTAVGESVAELEDLFPGLRRTRHEDEVTYSLVKYGVPYFASVSCSDRPFHPDRLNCAEAERLLRSAVRNLSLVGGGPLPVRAPRASAAPATRPTRVSDTFTYHSPGKLMAGTDVGGHEGVGDRTVYGDILFPIRVAPSFAQPQVFMHWGNCLSDPGTTDSEIPLPRQPGDTHDRYRCKQNTKELLHWEGHPENYSYPWRDNFCEARDRPTPECPGALGHQGQDVRASSCPPDSGDADRCQADVYEVVAVADGNAFRDGNKIRLIVDPGRLYYVYRNMNSNTLDAAGMRDQQNNPVHKGQVIGKVGNFDGVRGGTSTHVHFEIHPGSAAARFNPYMTLIRAYERLIGEQGTELAD